MLLPHRGRDEVIAALGHFARVAPQPVLFVLLARVAHLGWLVDFARDRDAGEGGVLLDEGAALQEDVVVQVFVEGVAADVEGDGEVAHC